MLKREEPSWDNVESTWLPSSLVTSCNYKHSCLEHKAGESVLAGSN